MAGVYSTGVQCVHCAHDHTVQYPRKRGDNIHFVQQGLGIGQHLDSLNNFIERNGQRYAVDNIAAPSAPFCLLVYLYTLII